MFRGWSGYKNITPLSFCASYSDVFCLEPQTALRGAPGVIHGDRVLSYAETQKRVA